MTTTGRITAVLAALTLAAAASIARADDDDDDELEFEAQLSGAQEVTTPPGGVDTDARGRIAVEFSEDLSRVRVRLRVADTIGDVTRGHFHCARPGVNGPVVFGLFAPGPCAHQNGNLSCTLTNEDLTDTANACEAVIGRPVPNIAALAFAMRDGLIYANVHTSAFPGGEIRGQLLPD